MVYCSALNCQNATSGIYKNSSVTFYGFPLQNKPLLQQWIQNMGRDMETPSKYQRLCSKHFEDSSFETDPLKVRKNRRLLKEAVPNKFILGEDGNWLVGTPQSLCGVMRNKTRKRIRNPEHWRVPGKFANGDEGPSLEDWQNEFYRTVLKENYGSLATLVKDYPVSKSNIPAGDAVQVKDQQDSKGRKMPASLSCCGGAGINWQHLEPGHGASMLRSQLQSARDTQLHGSSSGASQDLLCRSSDKGESSESRQGSARNQTHPMGNGRGSSFLVEVGPDEIKQVLFYQETYSQKSEVPWYICTDCGKSFACHAYLLRHRKTHTEKRPHTCTVCGKSFLQKARLTNHLRTHFNAIGVPKGFPE